MFGKKQNTAAHSLTFHMSDRSRERFDRLMKLTGAPDTDTVFREALRLYDAVIQEREDGNRMAVIKQDGTVVPYPVFYPNDEEDGGNSAA